MKNLILVAAIMLFGTVGFAQIKVVSPNGNVKVGVTAIAPASKLHVQNNGYCGLFVESNTAAAQLRLRSNSTAVVFDDAAGLQQGAIQFNIPTQQFIFNNTLGGRFFFTSNGNNMSFDNGNLGIGTSAATQALHVVGSAFKNDGSTTWLTISDKRLKKNIKKYSDGLNEVLAIEPVRFTYNGKGGTTSGKEVVGVLAQDMQKIAPYMIGEIDLADEITTEISEDGVPTEKKIGVDKYLTYDANALPYMLVNAIKEQQEIIELMQEEIQRLKLSLTSTPIDGTVNNIILNGDDSYLLGQNYPNPYSEKTSINYRVPKSAINAEIQFHNLDGKLLKVVKIQDTEGIINVEQNNLPTGTYTYSLWVDGKITETKLMNLAK